MRKTEFEMRSSNLKTQLHCKAWMPDTPPRAIVQIAHGICSHTGRFAPFAEYLCAHGVGACGNDHLGHGRSVACGEDRLFFAESRGWEYVLADMQALNARIRGENPGVPVFLLGHSMGSFLARCYAIRFHGDIDGLLLSGTGQQAEALIRSGRALVEAEIRRVGLRGRSEVLQNAMFGAYNRGIGARRTPYDWICRDPEVIDRYMADPLCGGTVTVGLMRDMLGGIAFMSRRENMRRIDKTLPVLFFSGSDDPVGEKGVGVFRAYSGFMRAGVEDVTLKMYPGGRHEMLNELNKEQVWQDVLEWMERRMK